MEARELDKLIDQYLEDNWEQVVDDIATLVAIPSVADESLAAPGQPFGPGSAKAVEAGLQIAQRLGFDTLDMQGYMGVAEFAGDSPDSLAIIGHVDVVDAGPGWTFEPYQLTRKDGFLMGRGTCDDKGPLVAAMHAVAFWMRQGAQFPYSIRVLLGSDEESGMADVPYYLQHAPQPLFVLTPDAGFPVCYGEKGSAIFELRANPEGQRMVVELDGGVAPNAVPGVAHAVVRADAASLPPAEGIAVGAAGEGLARIDATGKGAHASTPELGVSAIGILLRYLLDNGLCSQGERAFFELVWQGTQSTDGACFGIACSDQHFGPLTMALGIIALQPDGTLLQTIDIRFPTGIEPQQMEERIGQAAQEAGATISTAMCKPVFLNDPDGPVVQALIDAYNEVTGRSEKPFTMGGGTYARMFARGASYGAEDKNFPKPEWVGTMHGPDEGVGEDELKQVLRVYVHAIAKLMQIDLAKA